MFLLLACQQPSSPAPTEKPSAEAASQAARAAPVTATPWGGPWTLRVYGHDEPGARALADVFQTNVRPWSGRPRVAPGEVAVIWVPPGDLDAYTRDLTPTQGPQGEVVVVLGPGDRAWSERAADELPWSSVAVVDPVLSLAEWTADPADEGVLGALAGDEIGRHYYLSRQPYAGALPPGLDARLGPFRPELLTSPDPRTRAEAARAAPAGTDLHALAQDPFVGVRLAVAAASATERPGLAADRDPLVRARVADDLDDVAILTRLAHDPSSVVRQVATDRLARSHPPEAQATLRELLTSPDAYQRWKAAWGLGYFQGSAPDLIPLLQDPDIDVRREAARSLGRLRDPVAVPALLEALHGPNSFVRRWAAAALGDAAPRGDAATIAALQGAVQEPTALVAQAAAKSLGKLGQQVPPPRFEPPVRPSDDATLEALIQSKDATTRKDACKFLAGRTDHVDWLDRLAQDEDSEVRKSAVEAMGWSAETAPRALAHLSDPDPDVLVTSLDALRRGKAATVEAVSPFLTHRDAEVRLRAAEALAAAGPAEPLAALLTDPDERIRAAAAAAFPDRLTDDPALLVRLALSHPPDPAEADPALAPWIRGVLAQEDELVHVRFSWNDDADRPPAHRALRPPVVRAYGHPDRG